MECVTAKANLYLQTDVEGRRLGEQIGLDTLVVQAENYECYMLDSKLVYKLKCKHSTSRVMRQRRN